MNIRLGRGAFAGLSLSLWLAAGAASADPAARDAQLAHGRYLVTIGGCNDCHTPGYLQNDGQVPEQQWLTGSPVGYQGPWGTTYAANLRLVASQMTADQWVAHARQPRKPPMPWFNLKQMKDADLKDMYAFIRSLGVPGAAAPAYVAPGGKVNTPYFVFVPRVDDTQALLQKK